MALTGLEPSTERRDVVGPLAVDAVGLSKTYPNGTVALHDLTLSVAEGEVFGLLGPNGAGKTTTIGILTTLVRPTAGAAYVAGVDVDRDPLAARARMGVVFQDSVLDNEFTVAENLWLHARLWGMAPGIASERIDALLAQLGLTDRRDHGVRTLSGGLRRRVEIARGLLAFPRVLFLDEPTVGLDPTVRADIWRLVGDLRASDRVAVVLTTHYLEEAESVCDRVGILHRGQLVAIDRPLRLIEEIGPWVVELRITGDARSIAGRLTREAITTRPALVSNTAVNVTSHLDRADLSNYVGELARAFQGITAATVRPTTLSDVYQHLTDAAANHEEGQA